MAAPVVRNRAIAVRTKKYHLVLKSIGVQRPAVTENYGLTRTPVFVIDFGSVCGRNRGHEKPPWFGLGSLARLGWGRWPYWSGSLRKLLLQVNRCFFVLGYRCPARSQVAAFVRSSPLCAICCGSPTLRP